MSGGDGIAACVETAYYRECYREGGYGVRNYRHTEEKWMKKRRKQLSTG